MSQVETEVRCPVCKKAKIVAEVDSVATESPMNIPIGPASSNYYRTQVTSFHCSNPDCQIVFHHPPGRPNAAREVLQNLPEDQE